MRIALFSDTFFPQVNGVVSVVHHLAESLSLRGNEVCVCTVSRMTAEAIRRRPGVHYRTVTIPSIPMPLYTGERLTIPVGLSGAEMRTFKPDIIHAHTPFSMGMEAHLSSRQLGVPLVGTHHTFFDHYMQLAHLDFEWARRLSWTMTNRYYNRCATVVTPTRVLAEAMKQHGLRAPVEVIPNPVPLSDFYPRKTERSPGEATVVYMGRLSPEKNIDKVLEAFAHIQNDCTVSRGTSLRLVIIGDGSYTPVLEDIAENLGIRDRVTFTGFIRGKELAEELRTHDVFVTASKSENMPISVLEAMASGLPIVAPAALGLSEMVRHGENGFLVAPDDTKDMARRIVEIVRDPALRERFAAASRRLSILHDPDFIATCHEDLYQRLMAQSESASMKT